MEDYNTLQEKAKEARKQGDWELAYNFYEKIVTQYSEHGIWDDYFFAMSMYKKNMLDKSLLLCRNIYKADKTFGPNRALYAKNIAKKVLLNPCGKDINNIIKALEAIKKLVGNKDEYIRFDVWFTKTLKLLLKNKQYPDAQILLEMVDDNDFSDKIREINVDGKKKEIASTLEDYWVESAKINFHLANYDKTLKIIENIFKKIKNLHYSNHIWLKRLKAQTFALTDKNKQAIELYFRILRTKTDWFLYFELAQILYKEKKTEASVYILAKAAYEKQNIKFKIKLLDFIIRNNITEFDIQNTAKLLCAVYKENKWNISSKIQFLMTKAQVDCLEIDKKAKYQRLFMTMAKKISDSDIEQGTVIKTFNNFSGILKTHKKTYFFVSKIALINTNDKVRFRTSWSFDNKKKQVSKSAIIIDKIG